MQFDEDTPSYVLADILEEEGKLSEALITRLRGLNKWKVSLGGNEQVMIGGYNVWIRPGIIREDEVIWSDDKNQWRKIRGNGWVDPTQQEIDEANDIIKRAIEKVMNERSRST